MAYSFNVFSGTLDQVGSSAVVFEGEVETFADLPEAVGDPAVGASYLVRTSTGVWLVNRRQAGIWIRKNNTGVRATDWEYGGDYPVNSVNGQSGNVVLGASDVGAAAATHTHAASAITSGVFDNARVNFAAPSAIGSTTANSGAFTTLSAAPTSGSALTLTGGTVTASAPVLDATQTWNASGTTFTALRLNATNTASATASLLMDLQTGGTTQFSVRRDGVINASNYYRFTGLNSGLFVHSAGGGVISIGDSPNNWMTLTSTRMQLTGDLSLGRALSLGQAADTILARDAANTLALINGTNPQIYRVYGTASGTGNANFERLAFVAQSAASFLIDTQKGGTGSARGLELRTDGNARITISSTGGIGFYGAAASAQPAAVADATDAATVITQLNALLARLRTIGLIAT